MSAVLVSRFAPSPTGELHLGNARTALFNALLARRGQGAFLLRIEDTDAIRSRPEHVAQLQADLKWFGLSWDGEPLHQSRRAGIWRAAGEARIGRDGLSVLLLGTRAGTGTGSAPCRWAWRGSDLRDSRNIV